MYLYGEIKIHSQTDITIEDDWEWKTVTCGRKKEEILLNREPETDTWYDENGNEANITKKKKKAIKSYSIYD
jgi:hypothetical protein